MEEGYVIARLLGLRAKLHSIPRSGYEQILDNAFDEERNQSKETFLDSYTTVTRTTDFLRNANTKNSPERRQPYNSTLMAM